MAGGGGEGKSGGSQIRWKGEWGQVEVVGRLYE